MKGMAQTADREIKHSNCGIGGSEDRGIGGSNKLSRDQMEDRGIMILRSRDKSFGLRGSNGRIGGSNVQIAE